MQSDIVDTEKVFPNENVEFTLETIGEGKSKRLSKRDASIKMLEILKEKFEPLFLIASKNVVMSNNQQKMKNNSKKATINSLNQPEDNNNIEITAVENADQQSKQTKGRKNKAKNIVILKKTSPEYGNGTINPISRLIQIQQAKKEPEPVFEFIENNQNQSTNNNITALNNNNKRHHEYTISCTIKSTDTNIEPLKSEGKAATKKMAKHKAAEAMLVKLGYQVKSSTQQSSLKPVIKTTSQMQNENSKFNNKQNTNIQTTSSTVNENKNSNSKNEKKVKFLDQDFVNEQSDNIKITKSNTENSG